MSDLLDDLYLSPDEDETEESVPQVKTNEEFAIVETLEKLDDNLDQTDEVADDSKPSEEVLSPNESSDKTLLSTCSREKFEESFQKDKLYWESLSNSLDEEEFEKEISDILHKEKFKLFNETFENQARVWSSLSESLDEESFEKHIEQEILDEPFEIFLQNDLELFESLFQNGDNFWKKVKTCLTEEEFERLVQIYVESEDITWKRLTTEAFESITKPSSTKQNINVTDSTKTEDTSDAPNDEESRNITERKSKVHRDEKKEGSPKRERTLEVGEGSEEPKKKKPNTGSSVIPTSSAKKIVEFDMFEKETHKCRKCSSVFKSLKELKLHMLIHEKVEDVKPYICDLCPKSFKVSNQLRLHKEFNHSVNKPLTCNFCNRPFKQFDVLQKHRRRHYA